MEIKSYEKGKIFKKENKIKRRKFRVKHILKRQITRIVEQMIIEAYCELHLQIG